MNCIGMDTYPLSAGGGAVAADTVDEQDRMLPLGSRERKASPATLFRPAGGRQAGPKRPLAHARSLRDNWSYRAALTRRNRPLSHRSGDRL